MICHAVFLSAVRTYVHRHDNLNLVVQVNRKKTWIWFSRSDQGYKTISIICPKYKQAPVWWVRFVFAPSLPVWQSCSRYQQVPSFSFRLWFLVVYQISPGLYIFPQYCPQNLTQYHLIQDLRFVSFFFLIIKFTSSLLFKHFCFCSFFLFVHFWVYYLSHILLNFWL